MRIVEFCNSNSGFISAVLATLSFVLSAVAIFISVILSNRDTSQQNTFKTGINALKSDDIISSCGQRISCF